MPTVVVTGSAGLIGSEAVRFFAGKGYTVAGIDNDLYYMDKTLMLFGDAKGFVSEIVKELPARAAA